MASTRKPSIMLSLLFGLLQLAASAHPEEQQHKRTPRPKCKAIPGTPGWPSEDQWRQLNESISGQLIRPTPPGAVCHPGQATYDATACSVVQAGWRGRELHYSDPVSSMGDTWSNDTCLPSPDYPCSGQGYPVFVVNATTVEHVQLGVKFARKNNVRLIVKGTGHDFVGRSVAPNSLSIWTHHMKGIERHEGIFKPQGCDKIEIKGTYLTARAGTQMAEAYSFTDGFNETIVGGGGMTVGLGGWLTGAGHGILSPTYGLGVDQVLEMDIVTPKGEVRTLNECQNRDLFWAMRGGGGSTFGIMTSVTMKTHPTPKMPSTTVFIAALNPTSAEAVAALPDLVAYVMSEMPRLNAAGVPGYLQAANQYADPRSGVPDGQLATGVMGSMVMPYGTPEGLAAAWAPVAAHIEATWPGIFEAAAWPQWYPSFWTWFQEHFDGSASGGDYLLGSWLLDGEALTKDQAAVSKAMGPFIGGAGSGCLFNFVGGKGIMEAKPRGGSTAVLPAWRKAYLHPITIVGFQALNATAKTEAARITQERVGPLRELAPGMGAYMNEANPWETNWQDAFWGVNYGRLQSIKKSVDPDDVLWCHPCVGNEGWHEVAGQLCRV